MKRVALFSALTALTLSTATAAAAQSADETAIKNVLKVETESFYARDAAAWEATWLPDANDTRTNILGGRYSTVKGWDKIGPPAVAFMKRSSKPVPIHLNQSNFTLHADKNLAWMEYDQNLNIDGDTVMYASHEHRALVKRDGKWKIVSLVSESVNWFGTTPTAIEGQLNTTGYNFMIPKMFGQAIDVFKLNVQLFPNAWNTYDSLGEAYAAAGATKLAIENYEKSVALNPKNDSGKEVLVKLRAIATP
jgi:tetratricopeptide (TPR) repeat protein